MRRLLGALGLLGCIAFACSSSDDAGSSSGSSGTSPDVDGGNDGPIGSSSGSSGTELPPEPVKSGPRAVKVARATAIPACTVFVDAASTGGTGTAASPHKTIAAAVAAASSGAVICVAEGTYAEKLLPGAKYFTLAGGFKASSVFKVRDSSIYVTKAQGNGSGEFLRIDGDVAPTTGQLTAIDGFEITGYAQGIVRDTYFSQSFDITNNHIHDNVCADTMNGGGFALDNVSGKISGNVIAKNKCGRGGGGALGDSTGENTVSITNNLVDGNAGTEPQSSHGGALYLFATKLVITANELTGNSATGWGGGLYVGGDSGTATKATLSWNVYRDNRAGNAGGGFFCDDSATCNSEHEVYDSNCGGNIYLDSGPGGTPATIATFDHITNTNARDVGCGALGPGVVIDKDNTAADSFKFTNAIFWGNAPGKDFTTGCVSGCANTKVEVTYSNVQTTFANGGVAVTFGAGNTNADPRFVNAGAHDFHLQSTKGHWVATGYVPDGMDSPALKAGNPQGAVTESPKHAGDRTELGAYGNTVEASYVR